MSHAAPAAVADLRPASVLDGIRGVVAAELAPLVDRIDREGFYPAAALRALGGAGLFRQHLPAHAPDGRMDLGLAIDAMTAVGAECMATAFCTWCQDAAGWYLEHGDNPSLRARLQADIAGGAVLGGTGLSNTMKALSGIEDFKLKATRVDGGYLVSGALPWVSNLGDGHWFGTVIEDAADPAHRFMAMIQCGQPGVEIRANTRFIALEGTGTYAVMFRRALIGDDQVLADPLGGMVKRIKAGFILLQCGMGLGVIEGSVALMRRSDRRLGHTNQYLPRRADDVEADYLALAAAIRALAATPMEPGPDYLRAVLTARLGGGGGPPPPPPPRCCMPGPSATSKAPRCIAACARAISPRSSPRRSSTCARSCSCFRPTDPQPRKPP